jgi:predicted dithiol-disulfide oxidoreductase (DUF899 family)
MEHKVVSRTEWLVARDELLAREKELTHARDRLSAARRELPWVKVEKRYAFDAPAGKVALSDLFAGRSQLIVKHLMMAPGQQHQCVGCAFEVDHVEPALVHLENHDVSYVAIARAPLAEIEAYKRRMGWRFRWVSSFGSDFNYDFDVSFPKEDVESGKRVLEDRSGHSVFYKDVRGEIFHTYTAFRRGAEEMMTTYMYLDLTPKGRDEHGPQKNLNDWARPHDRYGKGGWIEPIGRYHPPGE